MPVLHRRPSRGPCLARAVGARSETTPGARTENLTKNLPFVSGTDRRRRARLDESDRFVEVVMSARFPSGEAGAGAVLPNGHALGGRRFTGTMSVSARHSVPRRGGVGRWAAVCCAAFVLAGCSGESTPAASSGDVAPSDMSRIATGNGSSSKSSSTTTSPPSTSSKQSDNQFVVPEAAKAHTHEGAKAFVKFYWESLAALDAKPATGVLPKFAASDCVVCSEQEAALAKQLSEGTHVEGSTASVTEMKIHASSTADIPVVEFNLRLSQGEMVSAKGERSPLQVVSQSGAARLKWESGGWKLSAYGAD